MVAYPAQLTAEAADDGFVVIFRDVPEAITQGDDLADAIENAADALAVALEFYAEEQKPYPQPSRPGADEHLVALSALVVAKLELYRRMCETGTSRADLAGMLGVDERAVRRLLAYRHRSHIGEIEAALVKLGKRLEVVVRDAA